MCFPRAVPATQRHSNWKGKSPWKLQHVCFKHSLLVRHSFLRKTKKSMKIVSKQFKHVLLKLLRARLPPREIITTLFCFYFYFIKGHSFFLLVGPWFRNLPGSSWGWGNFPLLFLPSFPCQGHKIHLSILYPCDVTKYQSKANKVAITRHILHIPPLISLDGNPMSQRSPIPPLRNEKKRKK